VTLYSGDMGDTSPPRRGHALEGVSRRGRTPSIRGPPARRRIDDGSLRGIRHFAEDGYKIHDRYKDYGVHGLTDRSRRPYRHANQLPLVLEKQIVRL
jgi:hypothetical protein